MIYIYYFLLCIAYGTILILNGIITKLTEYLFDYSPLYVTLFYTNVFYPVNIIYYLCKYSHKSLLDITKQEFIQITIPAIIYALENVYLFWALLYVPISYYVIVRTFNAVINIPFSIFYLNKKIKLWYYIGTLYLISSYFLIVFGYDLSSMSINEKVSMALVFFSGFTTSWYNNMAEKYFDNILIVTSEEKLKYQVIFNLYGFVFVTPITLYLAIKNSDFTSSVYPNLTYSVVGFFFQTYMLLKIYIVSIKDISGNQILIVVDLIRRIITNVIAYLIFKDYYNTNIIFANVLITIGCLFISFSVFCQYK